MSLLAATRQVCSEIEELKNHPSPSLQDLFVRFEIWAGNNGALRSDRLSLDWRVRKVQILRDMLLERLNDLVEDLRSVREISAGHEPDDIEALVEAAHEDVSALFKLSAAAKRSALRDPFTNALGRVGPERIQSEDDEAEAIGDRFPRLRQPHLEWLLRRLAQANGQRRRFLLHRALHQDRVLAPELPTIEPVALEAKHEELSDGFSTATSIDLVSFKQALPSIEQDDDIESQASFMSYATVTAEDQLFSVPKLEEISEGRTLFICPHCREEQQIKTQYVWERHVHADLRTYVCTFEKCDLSLFSTSHAWLQHHLDHLSEISSDQIPVDQCHFCDWTSKMSYSISSTRALRVSSQRYRRHVCAHLEQVAMLTIDHDEVEAEEQDLDSADSEDEVNDTQNEEPDIRKIYDWLEVPQEDDYVANFNYFLEEGRLSIREKILTWHQGPGKLFCLVGMPGSGMTTIVANIVQHLKETGHSVLYFGFNIFIRKEPRQDHVDMLRSLIGMSTSITQDIMPAFELFNFCGHGASQPSATQLASCFQSLAGDRSMTVVLDELDQCAETGVVQAWIRSTIVQSNLRFLLTCSSRRDTQNHPSLQIDTRNFSWQDFFDTLQVGFPGTLLEIHNNNDLDLIARNLSELSPMNVWPDY